MATRSSVKKGTDPAGTPVAAYQTNEGGEDRQLQRVVLADPNGEPVQAEATTGTAPITPVSIASTATVWLAASATRRGAWLMNNGTQTIFVGFTSGVTTANGIPIFPQGQLFLQGHGLYRGDVYGIVASGTAEGRAQAW